MVRWTCPGPYSGQKEEMNPSNHHWLIWFITFVSFLSFFFFVIIVGFPFINKGVVVFCVSYHLGYCLLSTAALNLELMSKSTGGRVLQLIFECYKVIQKTGKRFFFFNSCPLPRLCIFGVFSPGISLPLPLESRAPLTMWSQGTPRFRRTLNPPPHRNSCTCTW